MEKLSSVEGYIARAATGLLAGLNASKQILGKKPLIFPAETMLGALCAEIFDSCKPNFKPLKESYGILPPLGGDNLRRKDRHLKLYEGDQEIFNNFFIA